MMSWIGLDKFADVIFGLGQKLLYITTSNFVELQNKGIFMILFQNLISKSDWSLVPGPFLFLIILPIKRDLVQKK